MKYLIGIGFILALVFLTLWSLGFIHLGEDAVDSEGGARTETESETGTENQEAEIETEATRSEVLQDLPQETVMAENLTVPWDIAFLPDGTMLVTERPGRVVHIERDAVYPVDGVEHAGEGGLLGITLHPDFEANRFVYLYQTTAASGGLENRVVRYMYTDAVGTDAFTFDRVIIDGIPGASYHDGGRIAFGPDGYLYITTGDAGEPDLAQDTNSLAGKILRVTDTGEVPDENPFQNPVYSYGHRNPQGLAWDNAGRLFSTEHGRSGIRSGYDEINQIEMGANYGWPESEGDTVREGTTGPLRHSGAFTTWAPASARFHSGSLFFGGLRGEALYEAVLEGEAVTEVRTHLEGEYGRIRTVTVGPDGALYITTSNRDGRGRPEAGDDRIIRLNPLQFQD